MTDEVALTRAVNDAHKAKRLLEDDTLQNAFNQLEHDYTRAWRATEARDTDARERLWLATNVIGKVREHLVRVVNGGTLAQRELDNLANKRRRMSLKII